MSCKIPFYNPTKAGCISLGATQEDKIVPFKTLNGVFLDDAKIKIYNNRSRIKEFSIGDGLEIIGVNDNVSEKTLNLTLNGADFSDYKGKNLRIECLFFTRGDIEVILDLQII